MRAQWIPILVAGLLLSTAAAAQSDYDMPIPAESNATCSGPLCLMTNPAGLPWSPSGELLYLHHERWARDGLNAGGADGLLFSTPWLGFGIQYVRPDNGDKGLDYLKYDLALRLIQLGDAFALAAGLEILDPTETDADLALDYVVGAMIRPWRYVSLGLVGRHLAEAGLADERTHRSLDLGLAIRPLWFAPERLTLAADYRLIEDEDDPALRFTLQASIIDGLGVFGSADLDGNVGLGLSVDFLRFGVGGYTTLRTEDGVEDEGMLVMARASLDLQPGFSIDREGTAELVLGEGLVVADRPPRTLFGRKQTVRDVELAIRRAADDERIDSLLIRVQPLDLGLTRVQELRQAIAEFKKADKKVVVYLESATNSNYYLASAADAIYMNPAGSLTVTGPQVQALYFGGTLQLVGVEAEATRAGKYKSAPEMFTRQEPTPASREVLHSLADEYQDMMVDAIADGRGLERGQVSLLLDQGLMMPDQAEEVGLIDGVVHLDEINERMVKLLGHPVRRKPGYLAERWHRERWGSLPTVAVVHASGSIQYGGGLPGGMNARRVAETLNHLRTDGGVDAVVLRIDSPGGSGLASELIWREVFRLRKVKPVIVSMGAVAASGGYYMACPADWIVADPATITGSIGVFSLMFDASELYARLGISREVVANNKLSDLFTTFRARTPEERALLKKLVDGFYAGFVDRVAEGRKMDRERVAEIAQGRVWTGRQAKKNGLVDELGGLSRAIELARERMGLSAGEAVRVIHLPRRSLSLASLGSLLGIQLAGPALLPAPMQATLDELIMLSTLSAEPTLAILPFLSLQVR